MLHRIEGVEPPSDGENLKLYTGSCHCGLVCAAVKPTSLSNIEMRECNCSICVRVCPAISQCYADCLMSLINNSRWHGLVSMREKNKWPWLGESTLKTISVGQVFKGGHSVVCVLSTYLQTLTARQTKSWKRGQRAAKRRLESSGTFCHSILEHSKI